MMEDFIGTYGNNLIVAVVGVGAALLILAVVLWIIRRRGGSSPFIRGGKNRQPRLQVLDATAIDTRRRLVLVRRDNVEHLVMIGGPTDIVIESGIGAIPILKDVHDPQHNTLQSLPPEKSITSERTRAMLPLKEESLQPPVTIASAVPAAEPEVKRPSAVVPEPPTRSVATTAARPSAPVVAAVATPRPVSPPIQPATETPAAPRPIAREPFVQPVIAAVAPAVAATSLPPEPVARQAPPVLSENVQTTAEVTVTPIVKPDPVAAREPAIDQNNAVDLLDAARERVLPTFRTDPPINATATAAKPEPLSPNENGTVFGDQLTSDFESFLQAEIAKNNANEAPEVSFEPTKTGPVEPFAPPISGATSKNDVQKEMARIFGEMAVTRDR